MSTLPPLEERELKLVRPMKACAPDEPRIDGQLVRKRTVKTSHVYPPIPLRSSDWLAFFEDDDEETRINGWGETKAAAVADLLAQVED